MDIRNSLHRLGYDVHKITNSGEKAIQDIVEINPSLVLVNVCLIGELASVKLIDAIKINLKIPVLYLTDNLGLKTFINNKLEEPFSYIIKPFTERELYNAVEMALYKDKIQKQFQQENQKLLTVINSMGCAVVMIDINAYIQMINPIAEILTGWQQKEALGKFWRDVLNLVDKDTGEEIVHIVTQAMETGVVLQLPENCLLITRDGKKNPDCRYCCTNS